MKRSLMLHGFVVVAVFIVSAALSTAAFAETTPLILPAPNNPRITGESEGNTEFKSERGTFVCRSAVGLEITQTSNLPPLGLFHIHFKECELAGFGRCTGLGEAESGVLLGLGTWHLVWDDLEREFRELTVATVFLFERVHFSCSALVLFEVSGEQLCLDLLALTSARRQSFHCIVPTGTVRQLDRWCREDLRENNRDVCMPELITPKLTTSINHAAGAETAWLMLGFFEYPEAVRTDD